MLKQRRMRTRHVPRGVLEAVKVVFGAKICHLFLSKHHTNYVPRLIYPSILRACPRENQAGGDTAQITDFAQT